MLCERELIIEYFHILPELRAKGAEHPYNNFYVKGVTCDIIKEVKAS